MSRARSLLARHSKVAEDFSSATTPEELAQALGCAEGDTVTTPDGDGQIVSFIVDDSGPGVEVQIGEDTMIYSPEDITPCDGVEPEGDDMGEPEGDDSEVDPTEPEGTPVA